MWLVVRKDDRLLLWAKGLRFGLLGLLAHLLGFNERGSLDDTLILSSLLY